MSRHITPQPGSPDYNAQLVVYHRDIRPQQFAGILICSVAATIAVALRLYSQWVYRKQWALHDFLIVVALVRSVTVVTYEGLLNREGDCLCASRSLNLEFGTWCRTSPSPSAS